MQKDVKNTLAKKNSQAARVFYHLYQCGIQLKETRSWLLTGLQVWVIIRVLQIELKVIELKA
jgi:hypothetical protein